MGTNVTINIHLTDGRLVLPDISYRYLCDGILGVGKFAVIRLGEADMLIGLKRISELREALDQAEAALLAQEPAQDPEPATPEAV